ncbi:MAG TPA: hypothetical protein VLD35_12815 [Caldimonas sp.]|nr:hypothetical protein [Caldimonas sp.]
MNDADPSLIDRLVELDAQRESLPGEHWLAFALGVYLILRRRRSAAGRLLSVAAGALFVTRALTGRDGPLAALERRFLHDDDTGFAEVAAPWPHDQRVRVSKPRRVRRSDRSIAAAIGAGRSLAPSS